MFGHRVFLRIGDLPDASIMGLLKDTYELLNFDYSFAQGVDQKGKAQTAVRGGVLSLTLANLPSQELISWMLKSRERKSGSIVLCDADNAPLSKLFFKNAACVKMDVVFVQQGSSYLATQVQLQAEQLTLGSTTFTNRWVNSKQ